MHLLIALVVFVLSGTAINFLIKRWVTSARPVRLSGQRLMLGGAILLAAGAIGGASIFDAGDLGKLLLVGLLVYTLPHPLIFMALKRPGTTEADAAFIESAIPGSVLLLFSLPRLSQMPPQTALLTLAAEALILAGLYLFLREPASSANHRHRLNAGHVLLLFASLSTAAGILLVDLLFPSSGAPWRVAMVRTGWATLLAGMANWGYSLVVERSPVPSPPRIAHILGLALVGTVAGWTSLFWLAKSSMVATAVGIILIPVATALYRRMQGARMTPSQSHGAALILVAATVLMLLLGLRR